MLQNTFLHIPRIGYKTEIKLWDSGFISWRDYFERCADCSITSLRQNEVLEYLEESSRALANSDARHFEENLPSAECWRMYRDFRDKAAFVDIETTGLFPRSDSITVIGVFDGLDAKAFVQGINLEDFAKEIKKYRLLVTFNGKRFDLPFIRSVFGDFPAMQGHLDLMYSLRRLGYRGGLKKIEVDLGIERQGALKQVDGYLAVLLWREYKRGNKAALNTLIRYNLEDVVNLQYLADTVHNVACSRLPIHVDRLPEPRKYVLDNPYDSELIDYLSEQIREQRFNRGY